MGNGVLHSKHQKRAKPTPPSPSIPRLVGEKPRGRGVLFSPPHVHPLGPRPPKAPRSLKLGGGGERGPPRFPLPLNCTLLLGCSQVPPAPSPPAPPVPSHPAVNPPRSRRPPRRCPLLPAPGPRRWHARRPRARPPAAGARATCRPSAPGTGASAASPEPEEEEKRGDASRRLLGAAGARLTRAPPCRRRGPLARRPPLEERSVPSALSPKLYPWEKPAPPPLIAQGKKPAPAHPAAQELGNGTPTPPQRKPHRVAVTHGLGAAGVFPSFAPSCRL